MSTTKVPVIETKLDSRGYRIRLDTISPDELVETKQLLTITPITHENYPNKEPMRVFKLSKTHITVPCHFGIERFDCPEKSIPSHRATGDMTFAGALRDHQKTPYKEILDHFKTKIETKQNGIGLASLPTAFGKTVLAIKLASKLKQRTCILVHSSLLVSQWCTSIAQFCPNASIGVVQGKESVSALDDRKDFYVIMLPTLANIKTIPDMFGFLVWDEVHKAPCETFQTAFFKICCRYMLGLSATMARKDGLDKIIEMHFGPIISRVEPNKSLHLQTQVRVYKFENSYDFDVKAWSTGVSRLGRDAERTAFIVDILHRMATENEVGVRQFLVLSERREQLKELMSGLQTALQTSFRTSEENLITCAYIDAGTKAKDRSVAMECTFIFSTYALMSVGVDIKTLNSLVLASPKKDVAQTIGRIYRQVHNVAPLIVDIWDTACHWQFFRRKKIYEAETGGNLTFTYF